jgi:V/A-type H+-transporting ATPase subunit F
MKRLIFITPDDLPYGFAIAGLEQLAIGEQEVFATLEELMHNADVGVLILDERLLTNIEDSWLKHAEQHWPGILLILPAPQTSELIGEDYLQRMIRRALGYHVRIHE